MITGWPPRRLLRPACCCMSDYVGPCPWPWLDPPDVPLTMHAGRPVSRTCAVCLGQRPEWWRASGGPVPVQLSCLRCSCAGSRPIGVRVGLCLHEAGSSCVRTGQPIRQASAAARALHAPRAVPAALQCWLMRRRRFLCCCRRRHPPAMLKLIPLTAQAALSAAGSALASSPPAGHCPGCSACGRGVGAPQPAGRPWPARDPLLLPTGAAYRAAGAIAATRATRADLASPSSTCPSCSGASTNRHCAWRAVPSSRTGHTAGSLLWQEQPWRKRPWQREIRELLRLPALHLRQHRQAPGRSRHSGRTAQPLRLDAARLPPSHPGRCQPQRVWQEQRQACRPCRHQYAPHHHQLQQWW